MSSAERWLNPDLDVSSCTPWLPSSARLLRSQLEGIGTAFN